MRPSSSQQMPDGRQNSCKADPSCPLVAKIYRNEKNKFATSFNQKSQLTLVIEASIRIKRWFSKSEMMMLPCGLKAAPRGVVKPFK